MTQTTNQSRGFVDFDEASAPAGARPMLAGMRGAMGFVPSALARMAETPALIAAFQGAMGAFNKTSLRDTEREVIVLTMSRVVGCEVCEAMHLPMLARAGGAELARRVQQGESTGEERLDALVRFTEALLATRGDVDQAAWEGLLAAGFSRSQALEVVLGVGAYTISMYANRLTQAPVDEQLRVRGLNRPACGLGEGRWGRAGRGRKPVDGFLGGEGVAATRRSGKACAPPNPLERSFQHEQADPTCRRHWRRRHGQRHRRPHGQRRHPGGPS